MKRKLPTAALVLAAAAMGVALAWQGFSATSTQIASAADVTSPIATMVAPASLTPPLPGNAKVAFGEWTYTGPTNVAGGARDLAQDPATGDLYALSEQGWVFRSTDQTASWTAVGHFDFPLKVRRLELQLGAGGVTAFIGLTETSGADGPRLLRMTAEGTSQIHPEAADVVALGNDLYIANSTGVWSSSDNGAHWNKVYGSVTPGLYPYCEDLEVAGGNMYAACRMYSSSASKYTWSVLRRVGNGLFTTVWTMPEDRSLSLGVLVPKLAAAPSNPAVVYVAYPLGSNGNRGVDVFRTVDGGNSWEERTVQPATNPFNTGVYTGLAEACGGWLGTSFSSVLKVDPRDPDVVWTGGIELYRSDDGGQNFGRASLDATFGDTPQHMQASVRSVRFAAGYDGVTDRRMFVATPAGVYQTSDARAAVQTWPETTCATMDATPPATRWSKRIKGYTTVDFASVDVTSSGEVLASIGASSLDPSFQDWNSERTPDGIYLGQLDDSNSWTRISTDRPQQLQFDRTLGIDRFYTSRCGMAAQCRWDWNPALRIWSITRTVTDPNDPYVSDFGLLAQDPNQPGRLWATTSRYSFTLMRSDDALQTTINAGTSFRNMPVAGAVAPDNPNLVILGDGAGSIYRYADALNATGDTPWNMVVNSSGGRAITSIAFSPARPNRVFATTSAWPALKMSQDAGRTWSDIDQPGDLDGLANIGANAVVTDPVNPDVFYLATPNGLYVSWNQFAPDAQLWHRVPAPFDGAPVSKVILRKGSGGDAVMTVFTKGRGSWSAPVRTQRFADVALDQWSEAYVEQVARLGITSGCGAASYCPSDPVLREQMAVFLLRAMRGGAYQPPAATGLFTDVDDSSPYRQWIEQLAREGITSGCGPGFYCPGEKVSRAQMAVFLLRAKHGTMYQPPAATGRFVDVPVDGPMSAWVEQLANEGITGGCSASPAMYCPDNAVTREQMAVFLVKTFGL